MTNPPTPQEQVDPVSYKLAEAIQAQCDIWKQDGVTKWHAIDIYPIIRTTIAALTEEKAGLETKLAELRSGYLSAVSEAERKLIRIYIDKLSTLEQELGLPTDEPNPNGSTHARLNWWKDRSDDNNETRDGLKRQNDLLKEKNRDAEKAVGDLNSHLTAMRQALEPIAKLGENLQSHGPGYIAAWMADHKYVEAVPIALLLKVNAALKSAPGQELGNALARSGTDARPGKCLKCGTTFILNQEHVCQELMGDILKVGDDPWSELPSVGGRRMGCSNSDFERRCRVYLQREQEKLDADNGLISILCDAVRCVREYSDSMRQAIDSAKKGEE